ncbi:MAG: hypothetical protein WB579_06385 [Bryobacteraceae bacterium]
MRRILRTRRFSPPLLAAGLVVALALAPLGCKREPKTVKVVAPEGEATALASTVRTSETSQEPQLLNGFYGIENNSWRWTGKQFSVLLRTPFGGAQNGARLNLAFTIPQVAIDHAKTLTLSASVEGTPLPPETYNKSGQYEYKPDVPAAALNKEAVRIQFSLDKSIPPTGADRRELGIIVASIGLEPK